MQRYLSLERVESLIRLISFGTYKLYLLTGGRYLVGSSHASVEGEDGKTGSGSMPVDDLLINLNALLDELGAGVYEIVLKKNTKAQAASEYKYKFAVEDDEEENIQPAAPVAVGGLSGDKLEEYVSKRVSERLEQERQKQELKDLMKDLQYQMKELQAAKKTPVRKKESNVLAGLLDIGKMGAAVLIAEKWPKAVPLVEKTLAAMTAESDESDEAEEEEETGFTRPKESEQ